MLLLAHPCFTAKFVRFTACITLLCCLPSLSLAAEDDTDTAIPNAESTDSDAPNTQETMTTTPLYYTPNIPKKRAMSLLQHMELMERQDEVVQLPGLTEDYYGLYLDDATGNPQGGILILHDNQQHGHWPDIVAPLREYLPQHGWTTLTIELPDTPARQRIPQQDLTTEPLSSTSAVTTESDEAAEASGPITTNQEGEALLSEDAIDNAAPDLQGQPAKLEDVSETASNESLEPALPKLAALPELVNETLEETEAPGAIVVDPLELYRKQNQQRILAAMEYLRSKGQLNLVIIGYGIGASWAIDYLAQQESSDEDKKGLTLVTIDALFPRHNNVIMNQQLEELKLPYLDLIQPNKTYELKQGKVRRAIMKRNKNLKYQQIITSNMASYHENENPTNRRIRGWLKTNAGGTLVKMNP